MTNLFRAKNVYRNCCNQRYFLLTAFAISCLTRYRLMLADVPLAVCHLADCSYTPYNTRLARFRFSVFRSLLATCSLLRVRHCRLHSCHLHLAACSLASCHLPLAASISVSRLACRLVACCKRQSGNGQGWQQAAGGKLQPASWQTIRQFKL